MPYRTDRNILSGLCVGRSLSADHSHNKHVAGWGLTRSMTSEINIKIIWCVGGHLFGKPLYIYNKIDTIIEVHVTSD